MQIVWDGIAQTEDEHDVTWFHLEKGQTHECPVCTQVFEVTKLVGCVCGLIRVLSEVSCGGSVMYCGWAG